MVLAASVTWSDRRLSASLTLFDAKMKNFTTHATSGRKMGAVFAGCLA
jgi:hypothetical protein